MRKIIKYVMADILRSKVVLAYTAFLLVTVVSVFSLEDSVSKGLLGVLNIILIIVPLVSLVFAAIYVYNSAEFIELILSQPLRRSSIWISLVAGLSVSLSLAFTIGAGIPLFLYAPGATALVMLLAGILLSSIFVAVAMLAAVYLRDKAKGIGVVVLLWLYFSLLFDGLVLLLLFQFQDYPLEKAMVAVSALNPVDTARVIILLKMDISAMMGYTGAVFRDFFGTTFGVAMAFLILLLWFAVPACWSLRKFRVKDL